MAAIILCGLIQIQWLSQTDEGSSEIIINILFAAAIKVLYIKIFDNDLMLTVLQMLLPINFSSLLFHICILNCLMVPYYQISLNQEIGSHCKIENSIVDIIHQFKDQSQMMAQLISKVINEIYSILNENDSQNPFGQSSRSEDENTY